MAKVIDAIVTLKDRFSPILRQVSQTIDQTGKNINQVGKNFKQVGKNLEEHSLIHKRLSKDIENTGKSVMGLSKKMALISAPLIGAAMEGIKLNSEFTDGMAKVSTALDTTKVSLDNVRQGLINVSNATGVSVTELTQAEYQALSAGIASEKSVDFLSSTMKASKAGFADAETTINTVTTVLNAYGMQAEQATDITDQMITAQNFGKTTFADMGASLGNVIPIAAALNVKTTELFASIATLSKNGIQTSEAITGLKAAYSNILKPSESAQKMAKSLGIEFNAAHLQSVGWVKFLDEIKEKTGGNMQQMAKLFHSVEALNTITVLAGKGNADLAAAMDKMSSSAGATQEAYEKLLTPAEQNRIAMNQLKNASMELGQGLTPILKRTTVLLKDLTNTLNNLSPAQKDLIMDIGQFIIIGALLTATIGKGITMFGGFYGSVIETVVAISKAGGVLGFLTTKFSTTIVIMKAVGSAARLLFMNPIGIAVMTVIGLAYLIYSHWGQIKEFFINLWAGIVSVFSNAIAVIKAWMDKMGITEKLQVLATKTQAFIAAYIALWTYLKNGLVAVFMMIAGPIISVFSRVWSAITSQTAAGGSVLFSIINWITTFFANGFMVMCNIVCDLFGGMLNNISIVINGILGVLSGIITFLTGVFTGDWSMAWQGIVDIFSSIFTTIASVCSNVMSTVKSIINDVISGINHISIDIPDWVPAVGGQHFQPNIPMLARGAENWQGGPAMIHDAGPEIVDLPNGSRVIPHDKSMHQEYERGRKESKGGIIITIPKLADQIVIREDSDIDKIVEKLAFKLKSYAINQTEGAV